MLHTQVEDPLGGKTQINYRTDRNPGSVVEAKGEAKGVSFALFF